MCNTLGQRPTPDALQGKNLTASNLALRRVAINVYRENVACLPHVFVEF